MYKREAELLTNVRRFVHRCMKEMVENRLERNQKFYFLQSTTACVKEHKLSSRSCVKPTVMTQHFKSTGVQHPDYLLHSFKTPQDVLLFHYLIPTVSVSDL